jgi:hypothetical protein
MYVFDDTILADWPQVDARIRAMVRAMEIPPLPAQTTSTSSE